MVFAGLILAACATAPTRPPAPISTGQPRPTPEEVNLPAIPEDTRPDPVEIEPVEPIVDTSGYVTPPHMRGQNIKRIGVLLPFSHGSSSVRAQSSSLLAAIEMALFDQGQTDVLLLPKDTGGDARKTQSVTREVIDEGADIIIGPLFGDNVRAAATIAHAEDISVIGFSNTRSAAGGGSYLMSFPPEEEVSRVVDWSVLNGINRFAFMGPNNDYSRRVETALRFEAARRGGSVVGAEFYDPKNDAPVDEAQRLANKIDNAFNVGIPKVAIMIPDRGVRLRGVAPLMPYYGVDLQKVQYIGTSLWEDQEIWAEPVLENAVYASAPPSDVKIFTRAYENNYKREPESLASLGYDAAAVAISSLYDGEVSVDEIQDRQGFRGVNGLFRFRSDGTIDRGLAVLAITPRGPRLVEEAPSSFTPSVN